MLSTFGKPFCLEPNCLEDRHKQTQSYVICRSHARAHVHVSFWYTQISGKHLKPCCCCFCSCCYWKDGWKKVLQVSWLSAGVSKIAVVLFSVNYTLSVLVFFPCVCPFQQQFSHTTAANCSTQSARMSQPLVTFSLRVTDNGGRHLSQKECNIQGLNMRPPAWQPSTLLTELYGQVEYLLFTIAGKAAVLHALRIS